jgi:hypothetical protein
MAACRIRKAHRPHRDRFSHWRRIGTILDIQLRGGELETDSPTLGNGIMNARLRSSRQ